MKHDYDIKEKRKAIFLTKTVFEILVRLAWITCKLYSDVGKLSQQGNCEISAGGRCCLSVHHASKTLLYLSPVIILIYSQLSHSLDFQKDWIVPISLRFPLKTKVGWSSFEFSAWLKRTLTKFLVHLLILLEISSSKKKRKTTD